MVKGNKALVAREIPGLLELSQTYLCGVKTDSTIDWL